MYDPTVSAVPDGEIGAGFDEYLFYLITQVINRRNQDFAPALHDIGLSLPEWRAMSVINRLDGCLMSELSDFTTINRTTLTRTVDRLVEAGWVCRSDSATDRRQVRVALTTQGSQLFERAVKALKSYNARALDGLSESDLKTLRALLQRVLMNILAEPEHFRRLLIFGR